jgi:hypothetical protein
VTLPLQFLISIMPALHAHMFTDHRSTLLSRYFGLYYISFQVRSRAIVQGLVCLLRLHLAGC